jgi:hypothetical protein
LAVGGPQHLEREEQEARDEREQNQRSEAGEVRTRAVLLVHPGRRRVGAARERERHEAGRPVEQRGGRERAVQPDLGEQEIRARQRAGE